MIMIESVSGIDNLDDILKVEGLGGVIIGAADLAASMGRLGESTHPDVVEAIDVIFDRCRFAGIPFGMYVASSSEAVAFATRGAQIMTVGSDLLFLEQGMTAVAKSVASVREWRFPPESTVPEPSHATSSAQSSRSPE